MSAYTTRKFWADAAERALKTVAQTAAATVTASASGLLSLDVLAVASVSGLAGLLSLLTSIGSAKVGNDTASLVPQPPAAF